MLVTFLNKRKRMVCFKIRFDVCAIVCLVPMIAVSGKWMETYAVDGQVCFQCNTLSANSRVRKPQHRIMLLVIFPGPVCELLC